MFDIGELVAATLGRFDDRRRDARLRIEMVGKTVKSAIVVHPL
jgi:hypothetical protein